VLFATISALVEELVKQTMFASAMIIGVLD
jgi:hypothetical protein